MKLLHGKLSPFVRKIMIIAYEKGLADQIELVSTPVTPFQPLDPVIASNPLGKIPALILDDETVLYDSTVIAEYLDALDGMPRFFPGGDDRWAALRRNALADGILEAGMLARIEELRPADKRWSLWSHVQLLKVTNALNAIEAEADLLAPSVFTVGDVALACALGWLDFRYPDLPWRKDRPALERWYGDVSKRPAVARTAPELQYTKAPTAR
jgi:glutathione S-transferase